MMLTQKEHNEMLMQRAKLRAEEIRAKQEKLKKQGTTIGSGNVKSYHSSYFSKGSLLKRGYLDYNK